MIDRAGKCNIEFPAILSFGQDVWGYAAASSPFRRVSILQEEVVFAYGGSRWEGAWTFNIITSKGERLVHVTLYSDQWIKVF